MNPKSLAAALTISSAAVVALATPASADAPQYGPEWNPGPDYTNFQTQPDQSNFDPQPDQTPFEPGYAPGTADLLDGLTAPGGALSGIVGLFG